MSPFLFLAIDWIVKTARGMEYSGHHGHKLDDLDFADDFALFSHTKAQIQEKINAVSETSALSGQTS